MVTIFLRGHNLKLWPRARKYGLESWKPPLIRSVNDGPASQAKWWHVWSSTFFVDTHAAQSLVIEFSEQVLKFFFNLFELFSFKYSKLFHKPMTVQTKSEKVVNCQECEKKWPFTRARASPIGWFSQSFNRCKLYPKKTRIHYIILSTEIFAALHTTICAENTINLAKAGSRTC